MKRGTLLMFVILLILMAACSRLPLPTEPTLPPETEQTLPPETQDTVPAITETIAPQTVPSEPEHSSWYLPDVCVEDVIVFFQEVCLDGEIVNAGDPSFVQKWMVPIYYTLEGGYTEEDVAVVDKMVNWLNNLEGFPGITQTFDLSQRNLRICFCDQQEMMELMGPEVAGFDGAVTFWYSNDEIYDGIICCRTDLDQYLRNSVIVEEIYNGMGPIQDTLLRPDSIIYQEFSQPQWLTPVDELILQLLYHPDMKTGMDAQQCEQVIRSLYD